MNREIKFRGKPANKRGDCWDSDWYYGFLIPASTIQQNESYAISLSKIFEWWEYKTYEVITETIGQFIGLHDMKGMEIYEGDVLMIEGIKTNRYSKVWWNPDKFTFYIGHSPMDAYLRKDGNLCEFCIVGNIYDNPELIQEIA